MTTSSSRFEWIKISEDEQKLVDSCYGKDGLFRDMYKSNPPLINLPSTYFRCKDQLKNMKIRPDDVWLVSNPKTGTTWTQDVVWLLLNNADIAGAESIGMKHRVEFIDRAFIFGYSRAELDEYFLGLDRQRSPRVLQTHLPFELLPEKLLDICKVVFPTRNVKDAAVSFYYHEHLLDVHDARCDSVTYLKDIYLNGLCCYGGYWGVLGSGLARSDHPNMCLFWYEEMKKDQRGVILRIMKHLGLNLDNPAIDRINDFMKFENYQKKASVNKPQSYWKDGKGQFVRKGVVGDWKTHFSSELTHAYDSWIKTNLKNLNLTDPITVGYFQLNESAAF